MVIRALVFSDAGEAAHACTNMRYDGTYKIAKMCHGAAKVAVIAMGELGDIMGYAFADSESCSNLLPFWAA